MRITKLIQGTALAALLCASPAFCAQGGTAASTNLSSIRLSPDVAEIAKMAKAGNPSTNILAHIKINPRAYNLSPQDVVNLDKLGVPTELVLAMIDHDAALARQTMPKPEPPAAAPSTNAPAAPPPAGPTFSSSATADAATSETIPQRPGAFRRADGVVVLPIPTASTRTGPPPTPKRRWTSSTVVEQAPPPLKLELIPDSPGRDHIWIKGHWAWKGGWTWEDGYWVQRPGPDISWMDGFWAQHGKSWIWIPGRWR